MKEQFIEQIAVLVQKYASQFGIAVHSPIIAQAILESASGTSELATHAHNYFGLKYRKGRCPSASGVYLKVGSEQNADGSYTSSDMQWMLFDTMENGVKGYFEFINIPNYSNLKGVTDPQEYLEKIKADGYATSLHYVENLMNVISTYNLTKYDMKGVVAVSKVIAIDAGHGMNTSGKRITLSGYEARREWQLNDRIADMLEKLLAGYDCKVIRVDDTTGANDISLTSRVSTANKAKADVYISIHHNAGVNGGAGGGTMVFYYSNKTEREKQAKALYDAIVNNTGLIGNRSEKVKKTGFYVLKNTNMAAFLIENGFMDSTTDVPVILTEEHAIRTAQGILEFLAKEYSLPKKSGAVQPTTTQNGTLYRVQVGAFSKEENAKALQKKLKASGYDAIIVN